MLFQRLFTNYCIIINLNTKAGSSVFIANLLIYCRYLVKKKNHLKATLTVKFNFYQNILFLKKKNTKIKIFNTIDYNKIIEQKWL